MAINSTVFKVELNVADLDRHVYADHALTLARHPSETDERMMVRVLAWALHAHERLAFGRGIGVAEEPDLWQRDLTGRIELWIDIGLPEDRRMRKACGQSDRVIVYAFGGRTADQWWGKVAAEVARCRNLEVVAVSAATSAALAALVTPRMELQFMVQDGERWISCGDERVAIGLDRLMGVPATA